MKRAILHIGYPKTASTWFQSEFYPGLADFDYVPQNTVRKALRRGQGPDFDAGRARRIIAEATSSEKITLCKEDIVGDPHTGGYWGHLDPDTVADRLWAVFGVTGEVVVILRNQMSALASSYGQYLRRGGCQSPRRYISLTEGPHEVANGCLNLSHFDYDRLIACYESLFGPERVHVFAYEAFVEDPEGFLKQFTQQLGLGTAPKPSFRRRNASFGRRVYPLARWLNRFDTRSTWAHQGWHMPVLPNRMRKAILGMLGQPRIAGPVPDLDWLVGTQTSEILAERFAKGNQNLARRRGLSLEQFAYPGFR